MDVRAHVNLRLLRRRLERMSSELEVSLGGLVKVGSDCVNVGSQRQQVSVPCSVESHMFAGVKTGSGSLGAGEKEIR